MGETAERYRKVARGFTERVEAVPEGAWGNPSPCEGWDARDVVRHVTEWLPAFFFGRWDLEAPPIPSVDEDPVGAWRALDGAIQAALDDPEVAGRVRETPIGPTTFEQAIDQICTNDVLVHTWDLARAAGLDETLDPARSGASPRPWSPTTRPCGRAGTTGPGWSCRPTPTSRPGRSPSPGAGPDPRRAPGRAGPHSPPGARQRCAQGRSSVLIARRSSIAR